MMADLRPNPFSGYELERAYRFEPASEASFKGIELRAEEITISRGHDEATHSYPDVPGGDVEVTGRRPYVVRMETVWTGTNWRERLANAMHEHDTGAKVAGELVIPDGPIIDAKWLDVEERHVTRENAKRVACVFKEQGFAETHYIATPPPRSQMRSSVPTEDATALLPLVDDYDAALNPASSEALSILIQRLVLLDNAAYLAQRAADLSSASGWSRFMQLTAVRANARRAFPARFGVDLRAVLS
jgi:hypothetical protein